MYRNSYCQAEQVLKRTLNGKMKITRALVVAFLVTGVIAATGTTNIANAATAEAITVGGTQAVADGTAIYASMAGDGVVFGKGAKSEGLHDVIIGVGAISHAATGTTITRNVLIGDGSVAELGAVDGVAIGTGIKLKGAGASEGKTDTLVKPILW